MGSVPIFTMYANVNDIAFAKRKRILRLKS